MSPGYTPRAVVKLTGIPYSTLNLWAKQGFIAPSIVDAKGSGNERIYSEADVSRLRTAKAIREAGLGMDVVKRALQKFADYPRSKCIDILLSKEPYIYVRITRPK